MRVNRRRLVLLLGASFLLAVGFLWGAVAHDPLEASVGSAGEVGAHGKGPGGGSEPQVAEATTGHKALEAGLWAGLLASFAVFGAAMVVFRIEVRREKARRRALRQRLDLIRQVRDYGLALRVDERPNN